MFNPTDAAIDSVGIHEAVNDAIMRCPEEQQPILYRNIMMAGGNTSFKNFRPRLLEGIRGKKIIADIAIKNILGSIFFRSRK